MITFEIIKHQINKCLIVSRFMTLNANETKLIEKLFIYQSFKRQITR